VSKPSTVNFLSDGTFVTPRAIDMAHRRGQLTRTAPNLFTRCYGPCTTWAGTRP
jgi:hypothetical protein